MIIRAGGSNNSCNVIGVLIANAIGTGQVRSLVDIQLAQRSKTALNRSRDLLRIEIVGNVRHHVDETNEESLRAVVVIVFAEDA